jgi:hypothetical protein
MSTVLTALNPRTCLAVSLLALTAPGALAQTAATPPEFTVWAQLEAGITANPDSPSSGINFGHLFTDKTNQVVLDQLLVTAEKPLDPAATDYAMGFRLQGLYGTDARYTHFLGELDRDIAERQQLDIVEAFVNIHTPWLTDGGVDIKVGQFISYLGSELIDPNLDTFYSKSYICNFGVPLKHTGAMAIIHVNPTLDIYTGLDTGANTSLVDGDNNGALAFQGGFGLNNLMDGKLTVLVLTHLGPENPCLNAPSNVRCDSDFRYFNDVVATYKANDRWTFVTEINYVRDESYNANGYGVAQYATYTLNDSVAISGRVEVFRDAENFFVAGFPGNRDFANLQRGFPLEKGLITASGPTTYGEFTLGFTYKPPVPDAIQTLKIRPEIRYDRALNGTQPFNDGKSDGQFTFGLDFILKI